MESALALRDRPSQLSGAAWPDSQRSPSRVPMPMRQPLFGGMLAAAVLIAPDVAHAAALDGAALRWPWALPFIGILVTIATGPLLFPKIWHNHYGKLAFVWSALTVAPLAALYGTPSAFAAFVHVVLA